MPVETRLQQHFSLFIHDLKFLLQLVGCGGFYCSKSFYSISFYVHLERKSNIFDYLKQPKLNLGTFHKIITTTPAHIKIVISTPITIPAIAPPLRLRLTLVVFDYIY